MSTNLQQEISVCDQLLKFLEKNLGSDFVMSAMSVNCKNKILNLGKSRL